MRIENLDRLTRYKTGISDSLYLHYKFLFHDIKDAIANYSKGSVLDIGCGNKPYEPLFKHCSDYTGCDISQSSERNVDIICPSTDIPLQDNSYDTVFSTQVLEHVEDHLKMLQEAYRLLRPGGYIILSAPMAWEHHETPYDFFRFTRYGLTYLFEKVGFNIKYIKANGGKWALLGQLMQANIRTSTQQRKGIKRKLFWLLYRYFFKYVINISFGALENWDKDEEFITLNFVVVAQKPGP
jgi:SAM-dependent methyltransferase